MCWNITDEPDNLVHILTVSQAGELAGYPACWLAHFLHGVEPLRPGKRRLLFLDCVEIYITESCTITCDIIMKNYSAPSSLAEMTSWLLLLSKVAFPLIKVTEILLKSWLVGSLSSQPFFLARACPSRLTTSVATQ